MVGQGPTFPSSPRRRGFMIVYPQMAQMNADAPLPTQGVAGRDKGVFVTICTEVQG